MDDDSDAHEAFERELFQLDGDRESSDKENEQELEEILYSTSHYASDLHSQQSLTIDNDGEPLPLLDQSQHSDLSEPEEETSCVGKTTKKTRRPPRRYYDKIDENAHKICDICKEKGHIKRACPNWKKHMVCFKCNETGHLARDCTNTDVERRCFKCNEAGHLANECTNTEVERRCFKCHETGHLSRDCDSYKVLCYNCNETGHIAKDCTSKKGGKMCFICNETGHIAEDCASVNDVARNACHVCGESGHVGKDCKNKLKCFNCGDTGHRARFCNKFPRNHEETGDKSKECNRNTVCYNCNETGHIAKDCANLQKDAVASYMSNETVCLTCGGLGHADKDCKNSGGDKFKCFNCGETGHRARFCPSGRKSKDRKKDKLISHNINETADSSKKCNRFGDDGYEIAERDGNETPVCYICNQTGHTGHRCQAFACYTCGEAGHVDKECKNKFKCYNCGDMGHRARKCPHSKSNCNCCGKLGHYARDCPDANDQNEVNNDNLPLYNTKWSPEKALGTFDSTSTCEKELNVLRNIDVEITERHNNNNNKENNNKEMSTECRLDKNVDPVSMSSSPSVISVVASKNDSAKCTSSISNSENVVHDEICVKNNVCGDVINLLSDENNVCGDVINLLSDTDNQAIDGQVTNCIDDTKKKKKKRKKKNAMKNIETTSVVGYCPHTDLGLDSTEGSAATGTEGSSEDKAAKKKRKKARKKATALSSETKGSKENSVVNSKAKESNSSAIDHETLNKLRQILWDSGDEECSDAGAIPDHLSLPSLDLESGSVTNDQVVTFLDSSDDDPCDDEGPCYGDQLNNNKDRSHYNPTEYCVEHLNVYGIHHSPYGIHHSPTSESEMENRQAGSHKRKLKTKDFPRKTKKQKFSPPKKKKGILGTLKRNLACSTNTISFNATPSPAAKKKTKRKAKPEQRGFLFRKGAKKNVIVLD